MPPVKILSDSTCDLSPELIHKYEVEIIPLYINLGGEVIKDGIGVSPLDIYRYVGRSGVLPGTIASSVEDFRQAFEAWLEKGYEVVCHTISSDMSCTYQNACIAAEGLEGVYVIDSRNLSTGIGHVVINSAILARRGLPAAEIYKAQQELTPKVRASFVIETLDYLRKGGRCSSLALLGANLLKIKPSIVVEDGNMHLGRKYRGVLQKVIEEYVDDQLEGRSDIRKERIFITHTGCSKEIVDTVRERIAKHMQFDEVIETIAGCTITSHCGPNTLGILFIVE